MNFKEMTKTAEMKPLEEEYDAEWEKEYWNAPGHIEFYVIQNIPKLELFEIEVLDYSGCAGGLSEGMGIDYAIKNYWDLCPELREGVTYTLHNITVEWFRGDGWEIDDDVEYDFDEITHDTTLKRYLSQKIKNIIWRHIGCHIRNWKVRNERRN